MPEKPTVIALRLKPGLSAAQIDILIGRIASVPLVEDVTAVDGEFPSEAAIKEAILSAFRRHRSNEPGLPITVAPTKVRRN